MMLSSNAVDRVLGETHRPWTPGSPPRAILKGSRRRIGSKGSRSGRPGTPPRDSRRSRSSQRDEGPAVTARHPRGTRRTSPAAGIPREVQFVTKPRRVQTMIARAIAAGVPFAWLTADETYLRSSPKNHLTWGFLDHIRGTGTQERRFKGLITRAGKHTEPGGHSE